MMILTCQSRPACHGTPTCRPASIAHNAAAAPRSSSNQEAEGADPCEEAPQAARELREEEAPTCVLVPWYQHLDCLRQLTEGEWQNFGSKERDDSHAPPSELDLSRNTSGRQARAPSN
eukprot:6213088-Pyramimonas_sp.AAC.1